MGQDCTYADGIRRLFEMGKGWSPAVSRLAAGIRLRVDTRASVWVSVYLWAIMEAPSLHFSICKVGLFNRCLLWGDCHRD